MARRIECYVDTSAFIAFLDRSDSHHPLFKRLFSDPPPLVTSALVVAEGHGWFLRRYDQNRAIQFLGFIHELSVLTIRPFDAEELAKAARLVKKFADQKLTLADAHGLALAGERRTSQCWSTDRHLGLTGATLVV
jgi:predicted nucleic acid-binding protein